VLVHVALPLGVVIDHGSVVGSDHARRGQVLDCVVIGFRAFGIRVRCDEHEHTVVAHLLDLPIWLDAAVELCSRAAFQLTGPILRASKCSVFAH
jgi:hypothetical protein